MGFTGVTTGSTVYVAGAGPVGDHGVRGGCSLLGAAVVIVGDIILSGLNRLAVSAVKRLISGTRPNYPI